MQQSPTPLFYNFTIIGAGASGLWMAYALYQQGLLANKTLIIVEEDTQKSNDRTWCYWAKEELSLNGLASKTWRHSNNALHHSGNGSIFPYTYYHIRSQDFYQKIKAELSACSNITWLYATFQSYQASAQVEVKTNKNDWSTERLFLSALPNQENPFSSIELKDYLRNYNPHPILLWQSFVGWRIKTEQPIFDSAKMTMMDFNIQQNGHTQFMYVLPFSDTEALAEMTRFGEERLESSEANTILQHYLDEFGASYTIEETEVGAIPMTNIFENYRKELPPRQSVIYLGTLAGAIKPTTGYGFKRMAKYADDLAFAIKHQLALPTQHRHWRFRLYDTLLLQILQNEGDRGKEIFEALFKTQATPKILRFLDENTTLWEEISIFSRLPIFLFLKSLVKYIFK
jgi:lycopene beta-cyclase